MKLVHRGKNLREITRDKNQTQKLKIKLSIKEQQQRVKIMKKQEIKLLIKKKIKYRKDQIIMKKMPNQMKLKNYFKWLKYL